VYHAHHTHLSTHNAEDIVSAYDLVLDCTDHPTSRYLISDICVLLGKPLVSASAFQTSGQLITLNNPPRQGPCYRCIFPKPPPPDSVVGCGEGGILGPVVGVMGVLQALEAIKVLTAGPPSPDKAVTPAMLLFSAMGDTPFRSVRMRGRRKGCFACSDDAGLTLDEMTSSMDYVQFCGVRQPVSLLRDDERVTAEEYQGLMRNSKSPVLLDVREKEHFDLCNIPGSINVPISRFTNHRRVESQGAPDWMPDIPSDSPIYLVCRVGNDSQIAAHKLKEMGLDHGGQRFIGDVKGGLAAWKAQVDPTLPFI
jgi:adenylyltransferase and sulfurtransferase